MMCRHFCLTMMIAVQATAVDVSTTPAGRPYRSLNDLSGSWQLFVDDYLVAAKENVVRRYHAFEKHASNPVLVPDKPWEGTCVYLYGTVLPGESGQGYRMWYHALPGGKNDDYYRLLYATSADGIHWEKPNLGLVEYRGSRDNNIFIRRGPRDHIASIIHTPWETDPGRRYQMINYDGQAEGYMAAWSPDGLHWQDAAPKPVFTKGGDVGQFLWDPHTRQYLGYVKNHAEVRGMKRRVVGRIASPEITTWPEPRLVLAPDDVDDRWAKGVQRTHFYGLSAFAYESMYLAFIWVFRATDDQGYFDGPVFVELASSRDGINWSRQDGNRPPILPVGPGGAWDRGMVMTATQPLVEDGMIRLYYGGFDCTHAAPGPWHGAIGLATLRKDGFASLDADREPGMVLTHLLQNARGQLRVNYRAAPGGELRVEVLDSIDGVVSGYDRDDCIPLRGDQVDAVVRWRQWKELPTSRHLQADGTLRLRFMYSRASLYSFNVGPDVRVLPTSARP